MLKSILLAAFCAAMPMHVTDADAAAPNEDPNADASRAPDVSESASESSATSAPAESGTDTTAAPLADESAPAIEPPVAATADTASAGGEVGNVSAASTTSEDAASTSESSNVSSASDEQGNVNSGDASANVSPASAPPDDIAEHEAALAAQPNPGVAFEPVTATSGPTTGELTAAASAPTLAEVPVDDAAAAPVDQNTGKVVLEADKHAEAKDRFAGVLAALHQFEEDSVEKLKEELRAIGTLLHLHSVASSQADHTGDYKPSDLS